MSMATKDIQQIHVGVVAFPFGCHPRTLLNLLLKLATCNPNILFTFFNTQKSNNLLFSTCSNLDSGNIRIVDVEDGLPLDYHFKGNPLEPLDLFLKAADQNLRRKIETVVQETKVKITCLISDAFLPFTGEIAEDIGASWISVWIPVPICLSSHLYAELIQQKYANRSIDEDSELDQLIPGLAMIRVKDLSDEIISGEESVFSRTLNQIGEHLRKATAVVVGSYEELNPQLLNNDLKSKFKNFFNLGFLTVTLPPLSELPPSVSDTTGCLPWLENQPEKSVVYICFGTVQAVPDQELKALAEALEFSKNPFLWALKDGLQERLPNGFVERTKEQGKIVAWAPQTLVLAHSSVAVYVNHAGYNSVSESIVYGVPMICRPVLGDNMMVARMVEDVWGIGVTVEDRVITKDGLLRNLEPFLETDDERGKKMRKNIQDLKKVVLMAAKPDGSAARDIKKLMEIISMT